MIYDNLKSYANEWTADQRYTHIGDSPLFNRLSPTPMPWFSGAKWVCHMDEFDKKGYLGPL